MPPTRFDISLLGDKELSRRLAELPAKVERRVLAKAFRISGKMVLEKARSLVPVKSGRLKRLLKLRAFRQTRNRRGGGKRVGVVVMTPTREELGISADAKGYYPAHLELGRQGQAARPFMRPALNSLRQVILSQLATDIGQGIEREAAKKQ